MQQSKRRKQFLILEDDANDAILIRRAVSGTSSNGFVCRNTSEARAYLLGAGMYEDREAYPFPDIFITDLRLGEESGLHFLAWIRSQPELKHLPVVVLSGAASPEDVFTLKRLGAAKIMAKPANSIALHDMLVTLSRQLCRNAKDSSPAKQGALAGKGN